MPLMWQQVMRSAASRARRPRRLAESLSPLQLARSEPGRLELFKAWHHGWHPAAEPHVEAEAEGDAADVAASHEVSRQQGKMTKKTSRKAVAPAAGKKRARKA